MAIKGSLKQRLRRIARPATRKQWLIWRHLSMIRGKVSMLSRSTRLTLKNSLERNKRNKQSQRARPLARARPGLAQCSNRTRTIQCRNTTSAHRTSRTVMLMEISSLKIRILTLRIIRMQTIIIWPRQSLTQGHQSILLIKNFKKFWTLIPNGRTTPSNWQRAARLYLNSVCKEWGKNNVSRTSSRQISWRLCRKNTKNKLLKTCRPFGMRMLTDGKMHWRMVGQVLLRTHLKLREIREWRCEIGHRIMKN